jgi:hypothetical protein
MKLFSSFKETVPYIHYHKPALFINPPTPDRFLSFNLGTRQDD